jgi:hypothetical protein
MGWLEDKRAAGNLPIKVIWLCGGTTADIIPVQPLKFNMNEAHEKIKKQHVKIRVKSQMILMFDYMEMEISLFDGGRMLIKNVKDKELSMKAYREILKTIKVTL